MSVPREPFRYFFPLGLLFGIIATAAWLFYAFGLGSSYPGAFHADLMMGGFLLSFVFGFVLTAIPRFASAPPARASELIIGAMLILGSVLSAALGSRVAFSAFTLASLCFLLIFIARRIRQRQASPPPTFVLLPLALVSGILGQGLSLAAWLGLVSGHIEAYTRPLFYLDLVLLFVLSVGGRLIPAILKWQSMPDQNDGATRMADAGRGPALAAVCVATTTIGLQLTGRTSLADMTRVLTVGLIALCYWKLHKLPPKRGALQIGTWTAGWCVFAGTFLTAVFSGYRVHALHLTYIGGFGLLILMVAAQICVRHNQLSKEQENKKLRTLWVVASVTVLAALTRVIAPLTEASYLSHLGYAAAAWIAAVIIWAAAFGPLLGRREESQG